jgi:hypothetical protein
MLIWGLLKSLVGSKTLRRSAVTVAIVAASGDQIVKYVDKKHDFAVTEFNKGQARLERTMDERHHATMQALEHLQTSVQTIDGRVYDLVKAQRAEQASRLNRGASAFFSSR